MTLPTPASPASSHEAPASRLGTWHPGWMAVVLGTGGAAVASLADPLPSWRLDEIVGAVLTAIAVVLLPVLAVPYVLRLRRHRHALLADLSHPGVGALFGTLPASLLITAIALAQLTVLGWLPTGTVWIVLALLVLGVLGALLVGMEFFARVVRLEQVPVAALSGAWFIPIVVLVLVPSVVVRLGVLQPTWRSPGAVLAAVALWGAGLMLFLLLAPVIGWRLVTSASPPAHQVATWWIWLAPAGAGGLGVLAASRMSAAMIGGATAEVLPWVGLLAASVLWGFGVWWALFAGRIVWSLSRAEKGLPFHVGSWGFLFPTAAMTALTIELGRSWDVPFVWAVGSVAWLATVLVWARLASQTIAGVRSGSVFAR